MKGMRKHDEAAHLFVTGKANNVADAAAMVGLGVRALQLRALREGWHAQRDAHARAVAAAARVKALGIESSSLANARTAAWKATEAMYSDLATRALAAVGEPVSLKRLAERRAAGDEGAVPFHAGPVQARAIAQAAVLLARERRETPGAGDIEGLSLRELAELADRVAPLEAAEEEERGGAREGA